jgi:hypothetical protein
VDMHAADILRAVLEQEDFAFRETEDAFVFIAVHGGHKWKTVVSCDNGDILTIFSVFPWELNAPVPIKISETLTQYNREQRVCCFMADTQSHRFICRYGIPLVDPFSAAECMRYALFAAEAVTNAYWDKIFAIAADCMRAERPD